MRNGRTSPPSAPDDGQIAQEIERISGLDLAGVRALWRATYNKEPPGALTRDLLVRQLAWRIQEKAFGGHDAATLKLLDAYGRQDADKPIAASRRRAAGREPFFGLELSARARDRSVRISTA